MREIPLGNGRGITLVDDDDYDWLVKWPWHLNSAGYAARTTWNPRTTILMHREIIQPPPGLQVDHINRDPLDNRRSNLRAVTQSINQRNTGLLKSNTSGVRGVTWRERERKWIAQTSDPFRPGQTLYLGCFDDINEAEAAYRQFNESIMAGERS